MLRVEKLIKKSAPILLVCFSAILLTLAFPKTDVWILTWIGLVPLMLALDGQKPFKAFWTAYFCGVLFFAGTLYWLVHVTIPGAMLMVLVLSVYFGLFGWGYSYFSGQKPVWKLFLLPSLWVGLEFLRTHLFTGFGWASLGYSQYKNLPVIQIADITGLFGVSFLIVMVNVFLKEWIVTTSRPPRFVCGLIVVITLGIVLGYGGFRLNEKDSSSGMSVAVVQANIPQEMKWRESAWPSIMKKYLALTEKASQDQPDLIIWPETAFPGFLWEDDDVLKDVRQLVRNIQIPLLFGSVVKEGGDYYNSAIFLDKDGEFSEGYNKIHLVPFGEYIPLRGFFPFLSDIVPIADFTPGNQYTVYKKGFSVLICFEDTIAWLTRQFVGQGAQWLINITNDAWFQDTKEPFMHLQGSVFRAIENRRNLVRAANTGVSCFIDSYGRIVQKLQNQNQKTTFIAGSSTGTVYLRDRKSFYTKYGDVFAYLCFGCILMGVVLRNLKISGEKYEKYT